MKGFAEVLAAGPIFHQAIEQFEEDVFLPRADHVGAVFLLRIEAEEIPGLVDRLGAARQDERAILAEFIGVGDHLIGAGAMDLHAGDQQQLRHGPIDAGGT